MELDSNKYQELIRSIDIKNINLKKLEVDCPSVSHHQNIEISASQERFTFNREGELLTVLAEFNVKGFTEIQNVFSINFTLELNYLLDSQLEFENQYFELFTQNNVPVNVWPFARELVSNLTTRMGFPPLILPVLKV